MLVGQSNTEYVLIEAVVYVFGYLGLLCLTYFSVALAIGGVPWVSHPFSIAIETIGAIEILFYLFWYLPYVNYLRKQRPRFSSPLHREQRRDFLQKSLAACSDVELFVKGWMCGASLEDVRRENLKDWFLWALFDREGPPLDDDEELEEYVRLVEEALGRNIGPGWGPADSVRLNFQHLDVSHRSLVYYCIIGFVDFTASIVLLLSGFSFYRQPRSMFLRTFPFRPLTLFSPKVSASPHLSYFCRPHKSKTHRPIVFIHGLGIGVSIYIPFFLMLPKDVGILGIEFLPVTSHITDGMPVADDLVRDIRDVISQQMTSDFVFVGNSYGTFITKLFIESPYLAARMSKIVLIDPVAVLLQLPDLAYNFTKRKPVYGNEKEIWWAAQTEPDIAFNLARRFCWRNHILWREELLRYPTSVILGSRDCIVNAEAIAAYVTKGIQPGVTPGLRWSWQDRENWKKSIEQWTGVGLELVWLEGFDHGQGFLGPKMLPMIVKMVTQYCERRKEEMNMAMEEARAQQGVETASVVIRESSAQRQAL